MVIEKICKIFRYHVLYPIRNYWFDVGYYREKFFKKKLKIDSLPDSYTSYDDLMFHACFQVLVNCVEKEVVSAYNYELSEVYPGHHPKMTNREKAEAYLEYDDVKMDTTGYYKRNPIEREIRKKHHKEDLEILRLYRWWKDEYPNRECGFETLEKWKEEVGYDYRDHIIEIKSANMISHQRDSNYIHHKKYTELADRAIKLEEKYKKDDEQNFAKLIKLRNRLWY